MYNDYLHTVNLLYMLYEYHFHLKSYMFLLDLLPYAKSNEITHEFMYTIFEKIFKYLVESNNRESKVVNFKTPDELQKILDFGIKNKGESLETICNDVDKILEHVIRTGKHISKYKYSTISKHYKFYNAKS